MARASAKRAKRARSNARNAKLAAAQAAVVEERPAPVEAPAPVEPAREATPAPQRERRSVLRRKKKAKPVSQRPEDMLFFMRLRTHAKWMFAFLAAAFAIGFLAFGIGTGGGGVGDVLRDFFGGDSGTVTLEGAREDVADDPTNQEATLQLARLLQQDGRFVEANEVLRRYTELRPEDAEALSLLATGYELRAQTELRDAQALQEQGGLDSFGATVYSFPEGSGFLGALGENPVGQAVSGAGLADARQAERQAQSLYVRAVDTYAEVTRLTPNDATAFFQLGQAGSTAVQLGAAAQADPAIAAFEQYLELEPEGGNAQLAKDAVAQLEAQREAASEDVVVEGVEETG